MGRGQKGSDGHDKVGLGTVRRPVIGLALGGGAARGLAHIGTIRTLVAHGIMPNVVVGTSIGAVVGGAYASGHLDRLEKWARSLQPRNIFGYLDIRLNGSGLIGGAKLAAELEARMGQSLIEDLPVKFATVATEVRTGHEIWLTHGRIVDAMRASYALPGIFSPVLVGDRLYVPNRNADVFVLKADPEFELLAVNSIGGEPMSASLAVAEGNIFLRTHKNLWCIGPHRN